MRILENRVLRKILGFRRNEEIREWKDYTRRSFMICVYQTFV